MEHGLSQLLEDLVNFFGAQLGHHGQRPQLFFDVFTLAGRQSGPSLRERWRRTATVHLGA